jgi:outer membrane protein assembly factor BamA
MEYQRLRQTIFSRKVLVLHFYGGQSFELPGNSMPLYGLQALGNGTPLRAYPGSRYRHYAVAATSTEYRFPILRIMDGMFFNEYGVFGPSMGRLDFAENLRNSWGFGVRVRQPDMFLFRVEMAFNGFSGAVLNVSADTPF